MTIEDAFWKIHDGLPRQAPGSDDSTRHLLELAGNPTGDGLEVGCGQGRASLLLAQADINLIATDTHQPFLDELEEKAIRSGLKKNITTKNMGIDALDFANESFDILWSEGSAYVIGWVNAITSWKELLKTEGVLVATECCWLTDTPSEEVRKYWKEGYPNMLSLEAAKQAAIDTGYNVIATYTLPESDWWNEYYSSMLEKIRILRPDAEDSMNVALDMTQNEIDMYQKYSNEYGYVGFVLKKN